MKGWIFASRISEMQRIVYELNLYSYSEYLVWIVSELVQVLSSNLQC